MKILWLIFLLSFSGSLMAQFHTLNFPSASPHVVESQKLGVTLITIDYSSPKLNGRDVWNTPDVIPQKGEPIPWRAGANMATTIEFSTDVTIEGKPLEAGKYGFHIIPDNDTYTLLFAHAHDQWGSYYLDIEKDISLKVTVSPETCAESEQLDFEFLQREENTLVIGLEWGTKRIPFKVAIDLNETVVASFRSELRGINTYHWQAWNDAARWCLDHDTNLEEAYQWANRSINGGYGGFAANKNVQNLSTKVLLLKKLGKQGEISAVSEDLATVVKDEYEAYQAGRVLNVSGFYKEAIQLTQQQEKDFPDRWFLKRNMAVSHYLLGNKKEALKELDKAYKLAPDSRKEGISDFRSKFESGTFEI